MRNFYIILLLLFTLHSNAQQSNCDSKKYSEFDFWIGEWEVFNSKGNLLGTNTITKEYENCVIKESWVSKNSTNKGTSINFYDKTDNTWNQVWVDNTGYVLKLKGNIQKGIMILKSEITEGKQGKFYNKISWTPNKDGSVTQVWELFSEKNVKISEVFRGIYKKKLN